MHSFVRACVCLVGHDGIDQDENSLGGGDPRNDKLMMMMMLIVIVFRTGFAARQQKHIFITSQRSAIERERERAHTHSLYLFLKLLMVVVVVPVWRTLPQIGGATCFL